MNHRRNSYLSCFSLSIFRSGVSNRLELLAELLREAQLLHHLLILQDRLLLLLTQLFAALLFELVPIELVLLQKTMKHFASGNTASIWLKTKTDFPAPPGGQVVEINHKTHLSLLQIANFV